MREQEEMFQAPALNSPADHVKDCGEAAAPLQPMEIQSEANNQLQPMEDPRAKQVGAQRRL